MSILYALQLIELGINLQGKTVQDVFIKVYHGLFDI